MLTPGRRRARIVLTALLVLQILVHLTLPITVAQLPGYANAVIAVQASSFVLEITALLLLWVPASSRAAFADSSKQ
ncbi:hypothetical protein L2K70_10970 [Nocardioides KLBMP 9356]|uniref:Uncharacterized protein n=1 Tax=Nocardioides potassii TaxID=2911371 RepID=A0ABS9HD35_9ACTN|nr:hypothetical protein [Nocardioides potassii]MCF6378124.1 hypothetical protein [Nocardioides potassii]